MAHLTTCPRCGLDLTPPIPEKCPRCSYAYLRAEKRQSLRRNWRRQWLCSLYEFASPRLQHMAWIEGPGADWPGGEAWVSCFDESMCIYFDDLRLGDGSEPLIRDGLISRPELSLIASCTSLLDVYVPPNDGDHASILTDPDWLAVRREAAQAWHAMKQAPLDPEDCETMHDFEARFGEIPTSSLAR